MNPVWNWSTRVVSGDRVGNCEVPTWEMPGSRMGIGGFQAEIGITGIKNITIVSIKE